MKFGRSKTKLNNKYYKQEKKKRKYEIEDEPNE